MSSEEEIISPYFGVFQQLLQSGAAIETAPYAQDEARLYDVLQSHSCDLDFYKSFCLKHSGPILELGAGTGRVLLSLAELGLPMTAIEKEEDMIIRLREKGVPPNLQIIHGDVMEVELPKHQKVILVTLNFLNHFIGREAKQALLQKLLKASDKETYLIVDADRPSAFAITSSQTFAMVAENVDDEEPILYVTQSFFDESSGVDYNNCLKIPLGKHLGMIPTVTSWRWQPEENIDMLLVESGWQILESYGGYNFEPITPDSTTRLYLCTPNLNSENNNKQDN